jgi:hypothetical protein
LRKNYVASERMERHGLRTGLKCEPLMVCPQELYSTEAMRAFSDSRKFQGLVNTGCLPRNPVDRRVCAADLLLPAQDALFGFPVFKRHYWKDMSVFAMALFLGKPAILVEHHEFFRDGVANLEAFVSGLGTLRPDLKWTPMREVAATTELRREVSCSRREVRFFTDTFQLEQSEPTEMAYSLTRRVPESASVDQVLFRGQSVPFRRRNGFIQFEVRVDRPEVCRIQVETNPVPPSKAYSTGWRYQGGVAVRRGLSEVRDNVISRNRVALALGRRLMRSLRQTAD